MGNSTVKKILLFGFHDFASSLVVHKLMESAKALGIDVENVDKEDYLRPLGILSGAVPANAPFANVMEEEYEGNELPVRMLLFVGLSE
ncbi:MAG: hypothetical protein IJW67_11875, partial [Blautia sp.]|nr:hypothetical protein [Blautia sp.]